MSNTLDFRLEVKELGEEGQFSGLAAVYGVEDLGGDVIAQGAFSKTLQAAKTFPLLWAHNAAEPVGAVDVADTPKGLLVHGRLVLSVVRAREARDLLLAKAVRGLSIGYEAVRSDFKDGMRILREIKLYEVSLVSIPMNPLAQVASVKQQQSAPDLKAWKQLFQQYRIPRLSQFGGFTVEK